MDASRSGGAGECHACFDGCVICTFTPFTSALNHAARIQDEGTGRLWQGRGVGRGPLWVEGGEKRAQVRMLLRGAEG